MHVGQRRVAGTDGLAQRLVEGVDGTVALGGADDALLADVNLDGGLGGEGAAADLVGDHAERLDPEEVVLPTAGAAHEQLERAVGRLEVVALVLEALELVDDLRQRRTVDGKAQLLGLELES